jgi:predicted PurR-regulated permease PerM
MARSVSLGKGSKFVVLASICIVVAGLKLAAEVFIPLALAVLFTFVLTPLVNRLERWRMPRTPAVLIVVVLALCLVGFLTRVLFTQFVDVATKLPEYRDQIREKVEHLRGSAGGLGRAAGAVERTIQSVKPATSSQPSTSPTTHPIDAVATAVTPVQGPNDRPAGWSLSNISPLNPLPTRNYPESSPVSTLVEYLGRFLHPLATSFLVIVFVIFMLLNREDLRERVIRLVGAGQLNLTTQAVNDAAKRISRYLLTQAVVNLSYGTIVAIGLWIIGRTLGRSEGGFPNVLFWGLICGVFRFVPYIGPWIGAAVPLALAFGFFRSNAVFVAVASMFVGVELLVSQFAEPLLYGSSTGMSTIAVLASAVFWTWIWGPIGLLLSTPLTVILVVIGKYVPQLQFLDILLGDEPALEPHMRVYQRLLALDQEEAAELSREYLETLSLEEVYESILLPVLALAEHDHHRGQLDEQRHTFVRQSVRDLVEELGDLNKTMQISKAAKAEVAAAKGGARAADTPANTTPASGNGRATIPKDCKINVLCLPAHDEADDVAGLMLSQLLELQGYCAYPISQAALASEMVEKVATKDAQAVVVSALPPAAVAHARYLCKRLHTRFPELKMIVGLWTVKGDLNHAKDRLTCSESVQLATTFGQALEQLHQLVQPLLVNAMNKGESRIAEAAGAKS